MIPAFLCIDVEPDSKAPEISDRPWQGFPDTVEFVDGLRGRLAECSGVEPHPTWFFRMDPGIETCFGRADFVMERHGDMVDRLASSGDQFGIHVHPHRWDEENEFTYSDHTDHDWGRHCVEVAAETFEKSFGEPVRRGRMGGRFVPDFIIDAFVGCGIRIEMTVEPGLPAHDDDDSFGHHTTASTVGFEGFPTFPYRVSRWNLMQPATSEADSRPLVEIPMTAYDYETALLPFKRRLKRKIRGGGAVLPLNMWESYPTAKTYWDLVAKAVDASPVPYLAIVMRSLPANEGSNRNVREMLEYLPQHPLSKQLAFVDPLTLADLPVGAHKT
jgi:hypothetical protein